jgi:hypothetical protein
MSRELQPTAPPNKAGLNKKKLQRRYGPPNRKSPELVFWVMITMLLVKLAMILFGGTK